MKGYNTKVGRFLPNSKVKNQYKPTFHPMASATAHDLKNWNNWNKLMVEEKGESNDLRRTDSDNG
jgi:hypothetical protein